LTTVKEPELSQAIATVMNELDKDQKTVAKLGDSIVSLTKTNSTKASFPS
jgi:hypothetical protein